VGDQFLRTRKYRFGMFSLEYAFSVLPEGVVVGESKQGTQPYLAKPVDLATLTRVIEKHLK